MADEENIFDLEETVEAEEAELPIQQEAPAPEDDGYAPDPSLLTSGGGRVLTYTGGESIRGLPTRADLVKRCDTGGVSAGIQRSIAQGKPVFFMPVDVEEANVYRNGQPTYSLRIFGVLMDGSKADVVIPDAHIFFDVMVPDPAGGGEPDLARFDAHLKASLASAGAPPTQIETVVAFPGRGYYPNPKPFKRLSFLNLQDRKKAIMALRAAGYSTASDDRSNYYRKAAREEGLPLSDWAVLSGYAYSDGLTEQSPMCQHVFQVPIAGYRPLCDAMASKESRAAATKVKMGNARLARDRTLVGCFDIESYSGRKIGDVPQAKYPEDVAFMICLTFHWKDEADALEQFCLVDVDTAPDPRWTTIVCGSAANVLKAFALVFHAMAPDILTEFNGGGYDYPFIVEKARILECLAWMVDRMTASPRRNTTDASVYQWNYAAEKRIKISADDSMIVSYLKVPGCVPMDVRVCYRKLYPKAEASSLKFFLALVGLGGKADMPMKRMWQYYEAARAISPVYSPEAAARATPEERALAAENMRHVAHYCIVDSFSCQHMLLRRNVVNDNREIATLAYVTLNDVQFYAGGMRVCNLLGAYAWRRNMLVSMIATPFEDKGKYPGAHVFPPERGLTPNPERMATLDLRAAALRRAIQATLGLASADRITAEEALEAERLSEEVRALRAATMEALRAIDRDRPITGLDFSSLYPSLIMAYNLSPEKILLSRSEAEYWESQGRTLHKIEVTYSGRVIEAWSVRHDNDDAQYGLFPSALADLFAKRAEVKVILEHFGAIKEMVDLIYGNAKKAGVSPLAAAEALLAEARAEIAAAEAGLAPGAPPPRLSPGSTLEEELAELKRGLGAAHEMAEGLERLIALAARAADDEAFATALAAEYEHACFEWVCANTKQLALKVYMNTFYGETGNKLSAFFLLQLAGGVTSAGKYNLLLIAQFVTDRGFIIKYGDTDSLYLVCPPRYFAECDEDYVMGRLSCEEYWGAQVRISMRVMTGARDDVNGCLRADNGTKRLKVAYEEVLCPTAMVGKKKYFGIPHVSKVNFRPKKLFIRGIDVVKQGQSGMNVVIGNRIMWDCMSLTNRRSIHQITEDTLRDAVVNPGQWGFGDFVKTDAWKPHKDNKVVQLFMSRMRVRHAVEVAENDRATTEGRPRKPYLYELPEPGERFKYLIVKSGGDFDRHGLKKKMKNGDRMEYMHVVQALGLEIDVAFYLTHYVIGLCARFINSDPRYQPAGANLTEKEIDEQSCEAAKKALEEFIKGLGGVSSEVMKKRGYAYRRAYRAAAQTASRALFHAVGPAGPDVLHGEWMNYETLLASEEGQDSVSAVVAASWDAAKAAAEATARATPEWCTGVCAELGIDEKGGDVGRLLVAEEVPMAKPGAGAKPAPGAKKPSAHVLYQMARNLADRRHRLRAVGAQMFRAQLRAEADHVRARLAALAPAVHEVAQRYEANVDRIIDLDRLEEHRLHPELGAAGLEPVAAGPEGAAVALYGIGAADRGLLEEYRRVWFQAVAIELSRAQEDALEAHLIRLKNARLGVAAAPPKAELRQVIADAAAKMRPTGLFE